MKRLIKFDKRLVAPDLSNVVFGSNNGIGVKSIMYFPDAHADRKMLGELENGDVCLTRADGYNANGADLYIQLSYEDQHRQSVHIVEHKVSGIRSVTTDCRLFSVDGDEEAEYDLIKTYIVDLYPY